MKSILAARLKQCRKERGLSQINGAAACGISERAYQNYEAMKKLPIISASRWIILWDGRIKEF